MIVEFTRPKWQREAACRGIGSDLFFPERGATVEVAKTMCATCPVRVECLEYAVANCEKFGIWGGTSMRSRQRLRAQRRAS